MINSSHPEKISRAHICIHLRAIMTLEWSDIVVLTASSTREGRVSKCLFCAKIGDGNWIFSEEHLFYLTTKFSRDERLAVNRIAGTYFFQILWTIFGMSIVLFGCWFLSYIDVFLSFFDCISIIYTNQECLQKYYRNKIASLVISC